MTTERNLIFSGVVLWILLTFFLSTESLPSHNLTSPIDDSDNSETSSITPDFDIVTNNRRWNFFTKSNQLQPQKVEKARFYMAVVVDTKTKLSKTSPRFLSVSVTPRRVAGTTCIPWDSKKLKVK